MSDAALDAEAEVVVVGGGLAGCAAAIHLARRGRSVILLEAERYPVHKLCGEFLSTEAQSLLRRLGVLDEIWRRGAAPLRRVLVTSQRGGQWRGLLPGTAIGLSRLVLDDLLFQAAVAAGAQGRQGARVQQVAGDAAAGFTVRYQQDAMIGEVRARLVVGAFGKRSRLDHALHRPFVKKNQGYVAFKLHCTGADLGDWVELHAFPGGYCGMSQVEGGRVNVCLLARTEALRGAGKSFAGLRAGPMGQSPALRARLDALLPAPGPGAGNDQPISIGQIAFCNKDLFSQDVMMVGDTAALIAPLCGDGMSMALRGAELAAPLVDAYLAGRPFPWLTESYARVWRSEFSSRLTAGKALQWAFFRPNLLHAGLLALRHVPAAGDLFIRATRGAG